jgi:hypothetical protein
MANTQTPPFHGFGRRRFKRAQDGSIIFYPWGILTNGYVIQSEEEAKKVRRWDNVFSVASIVVFLVVMSFRAHPAVAYAAFGLVTASYIWKLRSLKNLPRSSELPPESFMRRHPAIGLLSSLIVAASYLALILIPGTIQRNPESLIVGGVLTTFICYVQIRVYRRSKNKKGPG